MLVVSHTDAGAIKLLKEIESSTLSKTSFPCNCKSCARFSRKNHSKISCAAKIIQLSYLCFHRCLAVQVNYLANNTLDFCLRAWILVEYTGAAQLQCCWLWKTLKWNTLELFKICSQRHTGEGLLCGFLKIGSVLNSGILCSLGTWEQKYKDDYEIIQLSLGVSHTVVTFVCESCYRAHKNTSLKGTAGLFEDYKNNLSFNLKSLRHFAVFLCLRVTSLSSDAKKSSLRLLSLIGTNSLRELLPPSIWVIQVQCRKA